MKETLNQTLDKIAEKAKDNEALKRSVEQKKKIIENNETVNK